MNQLDKLIPIKEIQDNPELYIKWMCYNLYITAYNQVFNLSMQPMKERLIGGSYCFYCNGRYRTKKWIRNNSVNIYGLVTI